MISIGTMVKRIKCLTGTKDVTAWENDFISDIYRKTNQGADTSRLSERQVEIIEKIHSKNFGDH
jgi:hypothetical protein